MIYPSDDLRAARRRLEEIKEISILDDLTWDDKLKVFYMRILICLDKEYNFIPQKTEWYITVKSTYPFGEIAFYPSKINSITDTFPHQSNNFSDKYYDLWRTGKLCLDYYSNSLGINASETEPLSAFERLYWHATRAISWLYDAANCSLVKNGDPYELPSFESTSADLFVFNEDLCSLTIWEDSKHKYGIAKINVKCLSDEQKVNYVTHFCSFDGKENIYSPFWNDNFKDQNIDTDVETLWVMLNSPLVVNHWQAPMTYSELFDACKRQNIDLINLIKNFARKARDAKNHFVIFGFPAPKQFGGEPYEIVWQALELPVLSFKKQDFNSCVKTKSKNNFRSYPGFRPGEKGWWQNDRMNILKPDKQLCWIDSENWSSDTIQARGSLPNSISGKRIAVIGAGSLGSTISEILVRAGVRNITFIDNEILEAGNLCRHTLSLSNIGQNKSEAIASKLYNINTQNTVKAITEKVILVDNTNLSPDLSGFDILIDTTGDDSLLYILSKGLKWDNVTFISASVGLGVHHIYLCGTKNHTPDFNVFFDKIRKFINIDNLKYNAQDLPRNGVGCWHPLFPARADDMYLAASTTVKFIESFSVCENNAVVAIYEENKKGNFFGGYTPIEVDYDSI